MAIEKEITDYGWITCVGAVGIRMGEPLSVCLIAMTLLW